VAIGSVVLLLVYVLCCHTGYH